MVGRSWRPLTTEIARKALLPNNEFAHIAIGPLAESISQSPNANYDAERVCDCAASRRQMTEMLRQALFASIIKS